MPNELWKQANELLDLVRKDPNGVNAGHYARAAAELLTGMVEAEVESQRTDRVAAFAEASKADLVRLCEESQKRAAELEAGFRGQKSPEPPVALTLEQRAVEAARVVESVIASAVAQRLMQHAATLESFVETGLEGHSCDIDDHGREAHAGRIQQARETAQKYRARAVELLSKVDRPQSLDRAMLLGV